MDLPDVEILRTKKNYAITTTPINLIPFLEYNNIEMKHNMNGKQDKLAITNKTLKPITIIR